MKSLSVSYIALSVALVGSAPQGYAVLTPDLQESYRVVTSSAPTVPQTFFATPQGDNSLDRTHEYFDEPVRLVKYVGETEEGSPWQATALKYKYFYLFPETGGQTGLNFASNDWRVQPDTPQDRSLNLLYTIARVDERRIERLIGARDKMKALGGYDDAIRTLDQKINAPKKDVLIFPRAIDEENAFFTDELGTPVMGQGFKFGIFKSEVDGKYCDVSSDYEVASHENGHHNSSQDNQLDFGEAAISGGYLEGVADISGFYHSLQSRMLCELRAALSGFNMDVDSIDNLTGKLFGKALNLPGCLRNLNDNVALTPDEPNDERDLAPNGYIKSGTEVHEIGRVLAGIVRDVHAEIVKAVWKTLPISQVYKERITQFGQALYDVTVAFSQAELSARILKEESNLSAYFTKLYQLLPDLTFKPLNLGQDAITKLLAFLDDRARQSNVRANPTGAPGADELPNNPFLQPNEDDDEDGDDGDSARAKFSVASYVKADGTKKAFKCSRFKKKNKEKNVKDYVKYSTDYVQAVQYAQPSGAQFTQHAPRLPQLNFGLTHGVDRNLEVVYAHPELRGAHLTPVFWPDREGKETWTPANDRPFDPKEVTTQGQGGHSSGHHSSHRRHDVVAQSPVPSDEPKVTYSYYQPNYVPYGGNVYPIQHPYPGYVYHPPVIVYPSYWQ